MADRMAAEAAFFPKVLAALKTWLAAVQAAVRRAWLKLSGRPDPHVVMSQQPLWLRLIADLESNLADIARQEFRDVASIPGDKRDAAIRNALAQTHRLLVNIPNEVQDGLQRIIARSVQAGKSPAEIEALVDRYLDASGSENWTGRARTIAVTEVHRMANAATQAAGMAISHIEATALTKKWVTRHDTRVRRDHVEADGQVVPLNGMFKVGSSLMLYPGDPMAPAEQVIGCRCSMQLQDRKS